MKSEQLPIVYTIVENYFKSIEKHQRHLFNKEANKYLPSIVPRHLEKKIIDYLSNKPTVFKKKTENKLSFQNAVKLVMKMIKLNKTILTRRNRVIIRESEEYREKMVEYFERSISLTPKIDGRIILIKDEEVLLIWLDYFQKFE